VARRKVRTAYVCDNKMHLKASRRTTTSQKLRRSPVKVAEITGVGEFVFIKVMSVLTFKLHVQR
jgi:hypothetical protein